MGGIFRFLPEIYKWICPHRLYVPGIEEKVEEECCEDEAQEEEGWYPEDDRQGLEQDNEKKTQRTIEAGVAKWERGVEPSGVKRS